MRVRLLFAWVIPACLVVLNTTHAADISGVPRVVDGDTLVIGEVKIRLEGIDAPETDQVCLDRQAARTTCGIEARDQLSRHIASPVDRLLTDEPGRIS
jgi:endonuclease YncB( thermonuclease family)